MKVIFTLLLLLVLSNIHSQKTISKIEYYKNSKQIYSRYNVLVNDTTIRQGEAKFYKKVNESDYKFFNGNKDQERLLMAKGLYEGNKQVGIWKFFTDKTYSYDVDRKKPVNFVRQIDYPVMAQELGIHGMVVLQYDIDSTFRYVNFKGLKGDSLLIKGAINDYQYFNRKYSDLLKKMSLVIDNYYQEGLKDTINYILQ